MTAYFALEFFMLIFQMLFYALRFVLTVIATILTNALLLNFIATGVFVGYKLCYLDHSMQWLHAALIGLGAALIVALIIIKLAYVRVAVLTAFGGFWGCCFWYVANELINLPENPRIEMVLCIAIGLGYGVYHIWSGILRGEEIGGDPVNVFAPFARLFKFGKMAEVPVVATVDDEE